MQLKILADSIPVREVLGPLDREVDGIFYDSRRVQKNGLYVAVRGAHFDGHKFTEQAIERGASAIVVERPDVAFPCHLARGRGQPRSRWPIWRLPFSKNRRCA